jgi:hypothetical protein
MRWNLKSFIPSLVATFVLFSTSGFSEKADLEILKKALEKALGEKTNYGTPRILTLERATVRGENNLFIAVHANKHLTSAGVRHGALTDVADILRVAKSWGWAEKISHIMILENRPLKKNTEQPRPLFSCSVTAQMSAQVKWESLDTKEVLQYLEHPQFYEVEE